MAGPHWDSLDRGLRVAGSYEQAQAARPWRLFADQDEKHQMDWFPVALELFP